MLISNTGQPPYYHVLCVHVVGSTCSSFSVSVFDIQYVVMIFRWSTCPKSLLIFKIHYILKHLNALMYWGFFFSYWMCSYPALITTSMMDDSCCSAAVSHLPRKCTSLCQLMVIKLVKILFLVFMVAAGLTH